MLGMQVIESARNFIKFLEFWHNEIAVLYVLKYGSKVEIIHLVRTENSPYQGVRNFSFSEYFVYVLHE